MKKEEKDRGSSKERRRDRSRDRDRERYCHRKDTCSYKNVAIFRKCGYMLLKKSHVTLCRSKRSRSRDRHRDRDRSSRKRRSASRSPSKNSLKDNGKDMSEVKIEREDSPQPDNAIPLMPVKTKP